MGVQLLTALERSGATLNQDLKVALINAPDDPELVGRIKKMSLAEAQELVTGLNNQLAAAQSPTPAPTAPAAQPTPVSPAQPAPATPNFLKKVKKSLGNKTGIWGLPVWIVLVGLLVIVMIVKSSATKIATNITPPAAPSAIETTVIQKDTDGLLEFGGVTVPVKVVSFAHPPFTTGIMNGWVISVLTFLVLVLTVLDNSQERMNQEPATRANFGLALVAIGMVIPGWVSFAIGATGLMMLQRPRKGAVMKVWPFLVITVLVLYIWFDVIAPNAETILGYIEAFAPWASELVRIILSEDNLRPFFFVSYMVYFIVTMFKPDNDQTPLIACGLFFLGWFFMFGVIPYLEEAGPELIIWVKWILLAILAIGTVLELAESGILSTIGIAAIIAVIVVFTSWGLREFIQPEKIWIMYLISPLTLNIGVILISSRMIFDALTGSSRKIKMLAEVIVQMSGTVVVIEKLKLAFPIDLFVLVALGWITAIMMGVNPWGF